MSNKTKKKNLGNDIESKDKEINNENNNSNTYNNINDETEKLNEENHLQDLASCFREEKLKLRPELYNLKKEVLRYGSDILDDDDQKKYEDRPALEKFGHKLYNIYDVLEHYIHVFLSIAGAIYLIYYTNLFYNLYFNLKIKKFYLYLSALLLIVDTFIFMYIYIYLPYVQKLDEKTVEKEFDEVVPYCTGIGVGALFSLIVSMWDVYRWYSIPIVLIIFWGIVMSSNIVHSRILGNIFFVSIITTMLFSYKFIEGPGKTYY